MALIDRIRAWVRPDPAACNTGDAVATDGGYANTGTITTGRYPKHAVADALREVLAELDGAETSNPPLTHAAAIAAVKAVAADRGIVL